MDALHVASSAPEAPIDRNARPRRDPAPSVSRHGRPHSRRHGGGHGDGARGAVAAQDRSRQRDPGPQAGRLARCRGSMAAGRTGRPPRRSRGDLHGRHRRRGGPRVVRRQLLHREPRAMDRIRSTRAPLQPPRASLARLLRHAPDGDADQHPLGRHRHDPVLRRLVDAQHPRRPARGRRNARPDVLARLGFRARRRRGLAVPAPCSSGGSARR